MGLAWLAREGLGESEGHPEKREGGDDSYASVKNTQDFRV